MYYRTHSSPLGDLFLVGGQQGLSKLLLPVEKHSRQIEPHWQPAKRELDNVCRQLDEYFAGQRTRFSVLLAPEGTAFQQAVWQGLCTIEYGATLSYGELAARIGRPKAARAVGTANGANPISIIIPCHRVIGSQGALTGYAGGLARKQWLLSLEQHSQTVLL